MPEGAFSMAVDSLPRWRFRRQEPLDGRVAMLLYAKGTSRRTEDQAAPLCFGLFAAAHQAGGGLLWEDSTGAPVPGETTRVAGRLGRV